MVKRKSNKEKMSKKEKDNTLAILTHAIGIFAFIFGALLVFLLTKDKEVKKHSRNALNWQISLIIYFVIISLLSIVSSLLIYNFPNVFIIFPFSLVISILQILNLIFCIIAGFKASEGELWRYPLTIDFIEKINEREIEKGKKELRKVYKKVRRDFKK